MNTITPEQLSTKNGSGPSSQYWIAIDGNVYDVSMFVYSHPGGSSLLVRYAGTDATAAFGDIGHSKGALRYLEQFYIGKLHSP
jgi:cytochrome b involved in lipid metabolism